MSSPNNPFQMPAGDSISGPPSGVDQAVDKGFRGAAVTAAVLLLVLLGFVLFEIGGKAAPAFGKYGFGFLTSTTWDSNANEYGILPEIFGTLYSSILALMIGGYFGVMIAVFLTQDFLHPKLAGVFRMITELLAAVPSVVYGLWGIYVVIPAIRPLADWLHETFEWVPFFGTTLAGPGMLPAALVLSIMILPTVAAISQDALRSVPYKTKEAAFGMGTTRWEAIRKVMIPTASRGIFGALVLGFGRALGETMALAMLVGNSNQISLSLFSPANTLAALLANNFNEADEIQTEVLMYAAIVLLLVTLSVNVIGTAIVTLTSRGGKA